ncbi:MAG: hypothetical protein ACJ8FK_19235, partial [Xanthobacteraceae bacterium]
MSTSDRRGVRAIRRREAHTGPLLQVPDHIEEILGLGISARPKHAYQALRRRAGRCAKLLEADRRLDVVAKDCLAALDIPAQHRIDAFTKKRFGKLLVVLGAGL